MKQLIIMMSVALGLMIGNAENAIAHSDHVHAPKAAVSEDVVKVNSIKSVEKLIQKKKLDATWKDAKLLASDKKKFGSRIEWVVSFKNTKEKDPTKRKLYVFMNLAGEYLAANHTGK